MNIGYLISTLKKSGPVIQLFNILSSLNRNFFTPIVITLSPEEASNSMLKDFQSLGIEIICLNLSRLKGIFFLYKKVDSILKEKNIVLLHSHGLRADAVNAKLKWISKLSTVHNYPYDDYCMKYGKLKGAAFSVFHLRQMKKIKNNVACSSFIQSKLEKHYIRSILINNGVDIKKYRPVTEIQKIELRKKLKLPPEMFIFISVGSLIPRKSPLILLEGFSRFSHFEELFFRDKNHKKTMLIIIGNGNLKDEVLKYAQGKKEIFYCGEVDNVNEYLAASDCFISASRSEGLPNSVLEALSCGLPAILSDIPAHREFEGQFFFRTGDPISLMECLRNFYESSEKFLGSRRESREKMIATYDSRIMASCYSKLYDRIIRGDELPWKHGNFSKWEKKIACFLGRSPYAKRIVKDFYIAVNYFLFRSRKKIVLDPHLSIKRISLPGRCCFFGYYDRSPVNSNGDLLYHCISNFRVKQKNEEVAICLNGRQLSTTNAWNYQQGAMLSWVCLDKIIYNFYDESGLQYKSKILNVADKTERILDVPIYTLLYGKNAALTLNFDRLSLLRPEYGYRNRKISPQRFPKASEDGVFFVDLKTGQKKLLVSIEELKYFHYKASLDVPNEKHKINHIQLAPGGKGFIFHHRWFDKKNVKYSRLYYAGIDGKGLRLLADEGMVSHCNFMDELHVCGWMRQNGINGYYKINIESNEIERIGEGVLKEDGHPSFYGDFMVTDSYPDRSGMMKLVLYHLKEKRIIAQASFFSPLRYRQEKRCDLHPRLVLDREGKPSSIIVDSTHEGDRAVYCVSFV